MFTIIILQQFLQLHSLEPDADKKLVFRYSRSFSNSWHRTFRRRRRWRELQRLYMMATMTTMVGSPRRSWQRKGDHLWSIIGQTINTSIEPKLLLNNTLVNKVKFGLLTFRLSCFLSAYFSLISSFSLGIFSSNLKLCIDFIFSCFVQHA
jgi:hypothetical protein